MPNSPLFFSFLLFFSLVSTDTTQQPKVFLHIGPHKTGTSTIQAAMNHNSDEALKEGYYLHPEPAFGNQFVLQSRQANNTKFQQKVLSATPPPPTTNPTRTQQETQQQETQQQDAQQIFRKEYDKQHRLLLQQQETQEPLLNWVVSAETLDRLPSKEVVELVGEYFTGYNVTIVAFVRNHLEHLRSYWLQRACAKLGSFPPLPEHLIKETEEVLAGRGPPGEQMFGMLEMYKEVFGKESIVLVDFDGVLAKKNSALPQVFLNEIVGLKFNLSNSPTRINRKEQYINTLNMWFALDFYEGRTPNCNRIEQLMSKLQRKFHNLNFLERCEDRADFDELSRKLESYFDEGWKKGGWDVLYKEEAGERRKKKESDCFVVKKERLEEAKQIGRQFINEEEDFERFFPNGGRVPRWRS